MALTAFCTVCKRRVYVDDDATAVCPVCSSPLLDTTEVAEQTRTEHAPEGGHEGRDDQPGGAK